jgi:hypothetical protein
MTGVMGGLLGSFFAAGAYDFIATANGTGSSGTVTFSSIPQDYKHLQIRYVGKNTLTNSNDAYITMNGVTSGVYMSHRLWGNGTTVAVTPSGTPSQTFIVLNDALAFSTTADSYGAGVIDILDYASATKNKTIKAVYGVSDATPGSNLSSGLYAQTTAVSSLTLTTATGSFTSLTRFSLYGIKG